MDTRKCCAIGISGEISSGKTTLATHLVDNHGFGLVSFGEFIRYKAEILHITPSRENCQNLGNRLIRELGPEVFLRECIEYFSPNSRIHVFDGVRHESVVHELRRIYGSCFIVFIEADKRLRYQRYRERNRAEDQLLTLKQFVALSSHPVEQDTMKIAESADLWINGNDELAVQETSIMSLLRNSVCAK